MCAPAWPSPRNTPPAVAQRKPLGSGMLMQPGIRSPLTDKSMAACLWDHPAGGAIGQSPSSS
jgi:hypothetical protein